MNKIKFKKCNFITSFFTIQFIHPSKRQTLINKVYKNLEWGGGFVFFEKVRGPDARFQDMISQMYAEYKYDNGYNPNEIFNKSKSLKGVMEPFSTKGNLVGTPIVNELLKIGHVLDVDEGDSHLYTLLSIGIISRSCSKAKYRLEIVCAWIP